jgi:aryl-alcohol dehydrogenase-like predicted oxidoreductase
MRTGLVDAVQVIYSIFDQSPEDELFPACQELNVGVIVRVALDEGSLGGKITKDSKFPASDWRSRYFNPQNLANTLERVDKLKQILPAEMSLPEMALRFVLSHPAVSTTIIGMRKLEHVHENIALSDKGRLSPELLQELKRHRWDRKPAPWSD